MKVSTGWPNRNGANRSSVGGTQPITYSWKKNGSPLADGPTGSGSTIRIDQLKADAGGYALYFHCQTDLVETFRERYPELRYGGNRSILLDAREKLPEAALRHCIALALTYHARKRKAANKRL